MLKFLAGVAALVLALTAASTSAMAAAGQTCLLVVEENSGTLAFIGPDGALRRRLALG